MEVDEDMEIEPMVTEVSEIDFEYEFDTARWYDFTQVELPAEAQAAEFWFSSAPSYPPSPFVTQMLLREEVADDKTEVSTKSEDGEVLEDVCEKDRGIFQHQNYLANTDLNKTGNEMCSGIFFSQQGSNLKKVPNQPIFKGSAVSNHKHIDKPKFRSKSSIRPTSRSSTLMKPTASMLAKQNNASKFHMQVDKIHEKGVCGTSGTEVQAAKRQKLDGGLLRKVADTKQEMSFVHKIPKKNSTIDTNTHRTRTKITIPQDPDFATSQRSHRIRHKTNEKLEHDTTDVYRFKARPFNRKIFDAPSLPVRKKSTPKLPEFQEFRLKTSERAMQHSSAVTTRSYHRNDTYKGSDKSNIVNVLNGVNKESKRQTFVDMPKNDVSEGNHAFKARTLNKKEFSFHSEKRVHPDLPTDLFSKLSIKSDLQPNNGPYTRFPQPKVAKENRVNPFQAGHEVTKMAAGKPGFSAGQQMQFGNSGKNPEKNQKLTASRSLGIR